MGVPRPVRGRGPRLLPAAPRPGPRGRTSSAAASRGLSRAFEATHESHRSRSASRPLTGALAVRPRRDPCRDNSSATSEISSERKPGIWPSAEASQQSTQMRRTSPRPGVVEARRAVFGVATQEAAEQAAVGLAVGRAAVDDLGGHRPAPAGRRPGFRAQSTAANAGSRSASSVIRAHLGVGGRSRSASSPVQLELLLDPRQGTCRASAPSPTGPRTPTGSRHDACPAAAAAPQRPAGRTAPAQLATDRRQTARSARPALRRETRPARRRAYAHRERQRGKRQDPNAGLSANSCSVLPHTPERKDAV